MTGTESLSSAVGPEDVDGQPEPHSGERRNWPLGIAGVVAVASLCVPIAQSGIWDPPELAVAELGRRIAVSLLGGSDLLIEGAKNVVPSQGELARGQLPFQSVAVGFRLFGLTEWAGRLPLALWGLLGAAAAYFFVARLADRIAASFTALVLATMPLYFLQARTILGDIVTMTCCTLATGGLALAVFDGPRGGTSGVARRLAYLFVGLIALGAGGAGCRGLLVSVAVPSLGVGLAWLVCRTSSGASTDRLATVLGAFCLVIGLASAVVGTRALLVATPEHYSMLVGAAVESKRKLLTHDFLVQQLGHGLFPWSAVLPFAIGRALRPPAGRSGAAIDRDSALRVVLLLVAALGLAVHGLIAPKVGHVPYAPLFALAALVALAMRDFELGAPGSRATAMGVAAFAILFYVDFKNDPSKGLAAFAAGDAAFPDSFKEAGTRIIKYGALFLAGAFFASMMERQSDAPSEVDLADAKSWPRMLRTAFGGNLWFALLVTTAALAGFAALNFASDRWLHWRQFSTMSGNAEDVARFGYFVFPGAVVLGPIAVIIAREAVRAFYRAAPLSRGAGALLGAGAVGAAMSFAYYPALATQISPKDVFTAYRSYAKPGEELAMMGSGAGTARYYAGRDVPSLANATAAFNWLVEKPQTRRWLVIRSKELPQINSMFRGHSTPRVNLPVLDARSSEILLVSNILGPGETNANPFAPWLPDARPKPQHPVEGNFADQLLALGWEVRDKSGRAVDAVEPGTQYQLHLHYEVKAKITGTWETFFHIDGFQRRYNGDHATLEGKYPFHLWLPGDFVTDIYPITLEPNFTPGDYRAYFGLFIGNRRLEVKQGKAQENRLDIGTIRVK